MELGINDIYMTRPAMAFPQRWRDSFPLGNGFTGATLYGGTSAERIIINRYDFWYNGCRDELPDVSYCVPKMRELAEQGEYRKACNMMCDALRDAGYASKNYMMRPLGEVTVKFDIQSYADSYKRILHLDTAEQEIRYKLGESQAKRLCFVSRKRDITVLKISTEEATDFSLKTGFFRSYEGNCDLCKTWENGDEIKAMENDEEFAIYHSRDCCFSYSSKNEGEYFGIVSKVMSDGAVEVTKSGISVSGAKESLILIKAFSKETDRGKAVSKAVGDLNACPDDYDVLFSENKEIYKGLYDNADLTLYNGEEFHSNEYLLEEARNKELTAELTEKLWRYGRYLFISGTAPGATAFALNGIWAPGYDMMFTQNVANENVQCIYWHAAVGGLSELVKPLIDYYFSEMKTHRENAKKLYGCKGIFVSTYTTPENAIVAPNVSIILHFLGCAGWLARHFYEYYLYTKDEETFNGKILPFMIEAAEFYEDFYYTDKDGNLVLYPGISPENSPVEFRDFTQGFSMPTTKNPTIEIAILKELLTVLVEISKSKPELSGKAKVWENMLEIIPDYLINEDGAVAEWIDEKVHDEYKHRHISHVYPLFPGTEVENFRPELKQYFKKAVDMRDVRYFAGWSMPHLAAVYSRLGEPQKVFDMLKAMSKVELYDSFFTGDTNPDMRPNSEFGSDEYKAPVQLDVILATVNAIQEMLIYVSPEKLKILPACPEKYKNGKARFKYADGTVSLEWDVESKICKGRIVAESDTDITVELPFGMGVRQVKLAAGEEFIL